MTDASTRNAFERMGDGPISCALVNSSAHAGDRDGGPATPRGHYRIQQFVAVHTDGNGDSKGQMQKVVGELLAAIRSLLVGDRDSAEVSVDLIAEMMDFGEFTRIGASAVCDSRSDKMRQNMRGGLAPWQVRRVTAHIESQLNGRITTQDLASIAKVSTCHFTRAFRESLSETPHEYVMRRRVERAQGLMLSTNLALGRIAIDCGFADQAHFNKMFRRLTGESPGAWRRARVHGGDSRGSSIGAGGVQ